MIYGNKIYQDIERCFLVSSFEMMLLVKVHAFLASHAVHTMGGADLLAALIVTHRATETPSSGIFSTVQTQILTPEKFLPFL